MTHLRSVILIILGMTLGSGAADAATCTVTPAGKVTITLSIPPSVPVGTPITVKNITDGVPDTQIGQVTTNPNEITISANANLVLKIGPGDQLLITAGSHSAACTAQASAPTLPEWGLIIMVIMLLSVGVHRLL